MIIVGAYLVSIPHTSHYILISTLSDISLPVLSLKFERQSNLIQMTEPTGRRDLILKLMLNYNSTCLTVAVFAYTVSLLLRTPILDLTAPRLGQAHREACDHLSKDAGQPRPTLSRLLQSRANPGCFWSSCRKRKTKGMSHPAFTESVGSPN